MLPGPSAGITFDEWAAANARIAKGATLAAMLVVLHAGNAEWTRADAAFLAALSLATLRCGVCDSPALARYARIFANPVAGRFRAVAPPARTPNRLMSYEAWARVQGHLIAASEAKADVQAALAEHQLTAAQFAEQAAPGVQQLATTRPLPLHPRPRSTGKPPPGDTPRLRGRVSAQVWGEGEGVSVREVQCCESSVARAAAMPGAVTVQISHIVSAANSP